MENNTLSSMQSKIYTDVQQLQQLKFNQDPNASKKEVCQQFEAILMQMVFSNMRESNKAFSGDLFGSDQMEMYQDMFDKQLSLMMSKTGVGFANIVENNINQLEAAKNSEPPAVAIKPLAARPASTVLPIPPKANDTSVKPVETFSSREEFISKLWSGAKTAAAAIGIAPEILLAQAALETDWGKKVISAGKESSHNLFNIKANGQWKEKSIAVDTLEQKNGVLAKERAHFRKYDSFVESFNDFVAFLTHNDRYSKTLSNPSTPEKFIQGLQNAGFATDKNYADKVMQIFSSPTFKNLIAKVKENI